MVAINAASPGNLKEYHLKFLKVKLPKHIFFPHKYSLTWCLGNDFNPFMKINYLYCPGRISITIMFFYCIFKLADRMRSMRTNGASKNRDYWHTNGHDFSHGQIKSVTLVPMVCVPMVCVPMVCVPIVYNFFDKFFYKNFLTTSLITLSTNFFTNCCDKFFTNIFFEDKFFDKFSISQPLLALGLEYLRSCYCQTLLSTVGIKGQFNIVF